MDYRTVNKRVAEMVDCVHRDRGHDVYEFIEERRGWSGDRPRPFYGTETLGGPFVSF